MRRFLSWIDREWVIRLACFLVGRNGEDACGAVKTMDQAVMKMRVLGQPSRVEFLGQLPIVVFE